jgi:hypothetical protein
VDAVKGLAELKAALASMPLRVRQAAAKGLDRGVRVIHREAIRNALRSPTQAQKDALLKNPAKAKARRGKTRKARATSRAKPGGLERSIELFTDVQRMEAIVYVAANSEAGKYAKKMHDEKGLSWGKPGPGSVLKGPRADSKFIARAINDGQTQLGEKIASELRKVEL